MMTKNCIVCGKIATNWTGHIHTEIGNITSGWCDEHHHSNRPISKRCTSINPDSCGGEYDLLEIEFTEDLTEELLMQQLRYMEFSNIIDSQYSSRNSYPANKKSIFRRIFWWILNW